MFLQAGADGRAGHKRSGAGGRLITMSGNEARSREPVPLAHRCIADQGRPQVRGIGVAAADGGTELLGGIIH